MTKFLLREGLEVQVDYKMVSFLKRFHSKSWQQLSGNIKLSPRIDERKILGKHGLVTLNRIIWWRSYGEWPEVHLSIYHSNEDPLDFRLSNLFLLTPKQQAQRLKKRTTPAREDRGIYQTKDGMYRVRGYDPSVRQSRYLGRRPTFEKAVELKRAFLKGEVTFDSEKAGRQHHRPARVVPVKNVPVPSAQDHETIRVFSDQDLINVLWERLFTTPLVLKSEQTLLRKRVRGLMKRLHTRITTDGLKPVE